MYVITASSLFALHEMPSLSFSCFDTSLHQTLAPWPITSVLSHSSSHFFLQLHLYLNSAWVFLFFFFYLFRILYGFISVFWNGPPVYDCVCIHVGDYERVCVCVCVHVWVCELWCTFGLQVRQDTVMHVLLSQRILPQFTASNKKMKNVKSFEEYSDEDFESQVYGLLISGLFSI